MMNGRFSSRQNNKKSSDMAFFHAVDIQLCQAYYSCSIHQLAQFIHIFLSLENHRPSVLITRLQTFFFLFF